MTFSIYDIEINNSLALNAGTYSYYIYGTTLSNNVNLFLPTASNGETFILSNKPQTIYNKIILSSGNNLIDATSIKGFTISSATPSIGDILIYDGASWYPTPESLGALYTWTPTSTFTEGQKFAWQAATNNWIIYVVRNGFTLNAGETPFTDPEKVDKLNPFSTFSLKYMTLNPGNINNGNGLLGLQNWLYDEVNDKYVIAGGPNTDNVIIFTRPNVNEIYTGITGINCGHDVMRVVYINNEYWAINNNVAGTLTITRINAVTNTIIGTFTSTYSGTLSGGNYIVRNNRLYYASFQSTSSFFRLYEIDSITLTTTLLIDQTTGSGFTYMVWWFDEVNGFICTSTNAANSFRVYNINTYALIGTYNMPYFGNNSYYIQPVYASNGKTYVIFSQSNFGSLRILEINQSTGEPTAVLTIGNSITAPNNAYQVLYDASNPDWALFAANNNPLGIAYFINVITGESVVINITMFSQLRYFNKQLEYYYYIGPAGVATVRHILRYDFR
jgi:hypothetical protein